MEYVLAVNVKFLPEYNNKSVPLLLKQSLSRFKNLLNDNTSVSNQQYSIRTLALATKVKKANI